MAGRQVSIRRLHRAGKSVQVTIPKEVIRVTGLQVGDQVYVYVVGEVVCVRRFDAGGFVPGVVAVTPRLDGAQEVDR